MEQSIYEALALKKEKEEMDALLSYNDTAGRKYGLTLTPESAKALLEQRNESLKKHRRVEFGRGILDKLVYSFCDSRYISQDDYGEVLGKLQDIFYQFKNESMDRVTDDELLAFMKTQFETVCFGDLEYLEGTCLERFAKAVRSGYEDFQKGKDRKLHESLDEEERWDARLYQQALRDLFWE